MVKYTFDFPLRNKSLKGILNCPILKHFSTSIISTTKYLVERNLTKSLKSNDLSAEGSYFIFIVISFSLFEFSWDNEFNPIFSFININGLPK